LSKQYIVKLTIIAISDAVTRTVKIMALPPRFHVPHTVAWSAYLSPSKNPTIAKVIRITSTQTITGTSQSPAAENLLLGETLPATPTRWFIEAEDF